MDWELILAQALTLVIVFDPLGNAPFVRSLLQQVEPSRRRFVLLRELFFVLLLLLVVSCVGSYILGLLGISLSSLNLTGGIMLFLIAIGLVFPSVNVMGTHSDESVSSEPFIVPLVVPLIVGPAAISIIMMKASMCVTVNDHIEGFISLVLAWLIQSVILYFSNSILNRIGDKGILSVTRLMGMILVLIAVQMILNGITDYIEHLRVPGAEPLAPVPTAAPLPDNPSTPGAA